MCGAIPPLPQYVFMAWCFVKHRDNFTSSFTLDIVSVKRTGRKLNLRSCYFVLKYVGKFFCHYFLVPLTGVSRGAGGAGF
jgi:hypothetical protein